jgi:hypothetical protein
MADLISPGIRIKEKDLTNTVGGTSSSIGGIGLNAAKGPSGEVVTISNETDLVNTFGKPNGSNYENWFAASSFLRYANTLKVVRMTTGHLNAASGGTGLLVKNTTDWKENYSSGQGSSGDWLARTAGTHGNNLKVWVCPSATAYEQHMGTDNLVNGAAAADALIVTVDDQDKVGFVFNIGDIVAFTSDAAGAAPLSGHEGVEYIVTATHDVNNTISIKQHNVFSTKGLAAAVADDSYITRRWRWYEQFSGAPGTSTFATNVSGSGDEMHVLITDEDGGISGTADTILELWSDVSKAADAKTDSGDNNYYVDVLYNRSEYIYWMDHKSTGSNWGTNAAGITFTNVAGPYADSLSGGTDDYSPTNGEKKDSYDYLDDDTVDVNLIIAGPGDSTHATNLIDLAEKRKDLMVFISPESTDVVNISNSNSQTNNVKQYFDGLASTSYAVFDSGYKKQYDRYNDLYRWVPLNGDIAGCCAATDLANDPWWSPAGIARGQIRGSVGLAYNPTNAQRDVLYRARINPVSTFPGEGTVLWGDKTALSNAGSAFSRISIRRLFNYVESAIETASRSVLFEFNDEFTQGQYVGLVEPFLRDVQGRRGITDFKVVCDSNNNTPQVIDSNEFRADIYIKPARSIDFITLTFIATRSGVAFSEITS